MSDELPQGWAETPLSSVVYFQEGPGLRKWQFGETGIPFLNIRTFENGRINRSKCQFVKREEFKGKYEHFLLNAGDLVVSSSGTLGKVATVRAEDLPLMLNTSTIRFRARYPDALMQEFLLFYVQSQHFFSQIDSAKTGSAIFNYGPSHLKQMTIALPPLKEQQRIVAKLDKLLPQVNTCQQRLERISALLKRFRQAVLAAACSGRLTEDWREEHLSDETNTSIVETIRRRRESEARTPAQREKVSEIYAREEDNDSESLPDGWGFVSLAKLCESFDYGTSTKSDPTGKVPVLRMGNIQNGKLDWGDLVYTSDEAEIEDYRLLPKTVLFNRTNSPELVGKTAIYLGERPAIFAGYLIRVNPYPQLDPEYLNFCLNTNYAREFCQSVKTDGVSQSNINAQKLGNFEVPFCPLPEQQEIVRRVEKLFALADRLEARFLEARKRVDSITQAILAKAFRGELVPAEFELAKAEGRSFESAEELLERIKRNGQVKQTKLKTPARNK